MWALVVLVVLLIVAAIFFQPDVQQPSPEEFKGPDIREGKEIPVLFGTNDIQDYTVAWLGDVSTVAIRKKGGKK